MIYVAGGAGIVGSGIVRLLVESGAKVWVSSRNEASLNILNQSIPDSLKGNLNTEKTNISNEIECLNLREKIISKSGRIDHVVASIGSFWNKGKLSDQSVDEFRKVLDDAVTSHFIVYKTFSKILSKQQSSYTFITGGLGEACFLPDSSLVTVGASSLYGLYQSALAEHKTNKNFSVNEIRYYMWIRNKMDKEFKSNMEVGSDWTAKFIPKVILKNKSAQYKILNRKKGDELFEAL